jgi:hypothetical protein
LSETEIHKGSCLCGSIRFTTRGPLRGVIYCHCTQCRKQSGHYYAATNVPDGNIAIDGGEGISWYRSSSDARRGFCRTCGSALFWKRDGSDYTSVLAGSFDQPSGLKGASHIFTADQGDYYAIVDGLPKNEAWSS